MGWKQISVMGQVTTFILLNDHSFITKCTVPAYLALFTHTCLLSGVHKCVHDQYHSGLSLLLPGPDNGKVNRHFPTN